MKKTILILSLVGCISFQSKAQDQSDDSKTNDYDKWSIDVAAGLNNTSKPFSDPSFQDGKFEDLTYNIGARYMFNEKFGLKAEVGFGEITSDSDDFDFTTNYTNANLQFVVNLGNLLSFRDLTDRFNLLFHAGGGIGIVNFEDGALVDSERFGSFIGGVTPQIKLSKSLALNLDLSVIGNLRQNYNLDGFSKTTSSDFDGMMVNATVGLSLYLGNNDVHADWYNAENDSDLAQKTTKLGDRLAKLENELQDDDRDGVPNYLDAEPNTINGVAVNTKGQSIDKNENGIPDEIETSLNKNYMTKSEGQNAVAKAGLESIKSLANDGAVSVYFEFGSDQPETYSYDAINKILLYLRKFPSSTASLTGYADAIGNADVNKTLSEKRAKRVYDILVASGIDASRLSYQAGGVDATVDKSSKQARQLVRRVVFMIK